MFKIFREYDIGGNKSLIELTVSNHFIRNYTDDLMI